MFAYRCNTGCPFCRKVREAVAILDLDVKFLPCPKVRSCFEQQVECGISVQLRCGCKLLLACPKAGPSFPAAGKCVFDMEPAFSSVPGIVLLQDGPTWRPEAVSKSGKRQFPYMEVSAAC